MSTVTGDRTRHLWASKWMAYVYVVVSAFVVWALLAVTTAVPAVLLPTPAAAFAQLGEILATPAVLFENVGATAAEVVSAFLIAAVCGLGIGVVVGSRTLLSRAYEPLLANLFAVPVVLLYPLLLGALGSGGAAKVIIGAISAGFPIAIATHWAVRAVDPNLLLAARSMGAKPFATIRRVTLPSILPDVFGGLRTGLSLAIVTVVAGEFLSATVGLGFQLARAGQSFQTPGLFAWLIVTVIVTAVMLGVLTFIQALISRKVNA
ncbi:MAG TPA: ABC transporter permease subunit [Microbacteriaceae bacterium]|nr:ABC transporter permease subunit [Microbacteriaceae bacterium]